MINSIKSDFNRFLHYDTSLLEDDRIADIEVSETGWYYMTLHNISLDFQDGYTPDQYSGYLRFCSTKNAQTGLTTVTGQITKNDRGVIFPLREPSTNHPKCKTYNRFYLEKHDTIRITYMHSDLSLQVIDRIVVTLHITNSLKTVYLD